MVTSVPLRWEAYEHEHAARGSDWFWALGIVAVSCAVISVLFGNVIFAILIVVAAGTLALTANKPPELTSFEVSDRGIRVGKELHRYSDIIAFWVEEERSEGPVLLVDTKKWLSPNLFIPIEGIDPDLVRAYLEERATERHMKEPVAHKILEFFGI
jgi:hypothetical protein